MRSADAAGPAAAGDLAPDDATPDDATPAAALRAWVVARDAVLRGLVHALSNRVGTVVAAGGMLEAGSAEVAGRVLSGEAERLELLLEHFRLVTADPFGDEAEPEPVVLVDVVSDAVALHAYAADGRDRVVTTVGVDAVPPALVSRAGLLHAMLVVFAAAGERAVALRADVGESGVVQLRTDLGAAGSGMRVAAWLLAASGVRVGAGDALLLPAFGTPHARGARS